MIKQDLINTVIDQIEKDVHDRDFTALEELLQFVPEKYLVAYLPEIVQEHLRG